MPIQLNIHESQPTTSLTENAAIYTVYSLRISNQSEQENQYIILFEKWLKEKLSCYIVKATAGIHNDSKTPHFHYHVIVNEPEGLKISASISGTQGFRNFSKLKQHKDDIVLPKGNDLKVCRKTDQDINCALKYPLKCGLPLPVGCYNVDLSTLTKEAQETFKNAPTRVYKKKKSDLKTKCLEYLDSQIDFIKSQIETREVPDYIMDTQCGYKTVVCSRLEAYSEAIKLARQFYIKEDPEASPNTAGCVAMKWLNGRGIISDRDYIRMYSPISRLM